MVPQFSLDLEYVQLFPQKLIVAICFLSKLYTYQLMYHTDADVKSCQLLLDKVCPFSFTYRELTFSVVTLCPMCSELAVNLTNFFKSVYI